MQTTISNIDAIAPQLLAEPSILIREPVVADGARIWAMAKDSRVLDANSSYAYLLWCRDFADTSVVAEIDGELAGFVTGYTRPQDPHTIFVWQVAVDHRHRGRGLGVALLDALVEGQARQGVSRLETTISPDNPASIAMFRSLARRRGARLTRSALFAPGDFPDGHEPEDLYRIAPITHQEEWR
ncbi:diaminobutyrate acetyltransferase [Nocardia inohanensis]|uniref:diaminobutyrate acetyltransferase n=1 Tax=Nocardia inohanensis TaxID=209246 RepID=UPI0008365CC1|nr:diaminobutyrate acetyltransferase [Nocardia inohanensis]